MSQVDTCVIFNPAAGQGRSKARLKRLQEVLGRHAEFRSTNAPGHAEELALQAAQEGYPCVGAAGGDGTLHEVANGLMRAERKGVELAVFPMGSANDYIVSLGLDLAWWHQANGSAHSRPVDIGFARGADGRTRYFINGMGLGFNAGVTLERNRIPLLRGVPLYCLGLLSAMCFRFHKPVIKVTFICDDDSSKGPVVREIPTLALTVALGRREGNFMLTPSAVLDDGFFDYLHAGALGRFELVRHLPQMLSGDLPYDHPQIFAGRCHKAVIESEAALAAHLDGELFHRPEDNAHRIEVSILKHALNVRMGLAARV